MDHVESSSINITLISLGNALLDYLSKQESECPRILDENGLYMAPIGGMGDYGSTSRFQYSLLQGKTKDFDKKKMLELIKFIITHIELFGENSEGISSLLLVAATHPELRPYVLGLGEKIFKHLPSNTQTEYISILRGSIKPGEKDGKPVAIKILTHPDLEPYDFMTLVHFFLMEGDTDILTDAIIDKAIEYSKLGGGLEIFYKRDILPLLKTLKNARGGTKDALN